MSKAAFTLKAFAVYLFAVGPLLLLAPNLLLNALRHPETREVWIRVLGVVVFNLGIYYWFAAKSEARAFFAASVFTRMFVLIAFIALVLLGHAKPVLIPFGLIDFAGALWTLYALKSDPPLISK